MPKRRLTVKEDFAMYETQIRKGREELNRGELVPWEEVKKKAARLKKSPKSKKAS